MFGVHRFSTRLLIEKKIAQEKVVAMEKRKQEMARKTNLSLRDIEPVRFPFTDLFFFYCYIDWW